MSTINNRRRDEETQTTAKMPTSNTTVTASQNALIPYPGAKVYTRNGAVNVRRDSSTTSAILTTVAREKQIGLFAGKIEDHIDGKWLQVSIPGGFGWVRSDVVIVVNPSAKVPTDAETESVVNQLQKTDEKIFNTLLRSLPKMQAAKAKGINVTAHETQYKALYSRFSVRQKALKESTAIKCQTGIQSTYVELRDKLKAWLGISGIGEPVTLATVCVIAILSVAATATVYYIFKPKYDESTKDLVISSDLEKALSTLSPEKQEAVKADLEKQVDDAYNQGKTDGTFGGMGKVLLYGGIAFAGFLALTKLTQNSKS